ncbi:MAG: hypothetical protein NTW29_12560 [Bacteroidetes bacterium]|nr:hypothetical protein [Bacteroidota bacterium]
MELTGPSKTKWLKIKADIIKRPFLSFIIKLSENEMITYFINDQFPDKERIEEIYRTLINDRKNKANKLKDILATKVGHRGSVRFANKIGVSDTTIRNIIDKKYKFPPSYDILCKIETYLSYTTKFQVSLEHLNIANSFVSETIDQLKEEALKIFDIFKWIAFHLDELKLADKHIKHYFGDKKANKLTIGQIQRNIEKAIEDLSNLKLDIDTLVQDFCE